MSEPPLPQWRPPSDAPTSTNDEQKVFDTIVGPNLRLLDNLIQLGAIVAGTLLGAGAGAIYGGTNRGDAIGWALAGGFGGLILSLLLSGFVIGLVRAILVAKR